MRPLRSLFTAAVVFAAVPCFATETHAAPASQGQQKSTERPHVDVAFVLDTTGSMGGLLEGAKQKIWSISSKIARGKPAPILRVGLVAYRDVGDTYVAQRFELTGDLDAVYAQLKSFNADGGGDTPEHVGRGLGEAVKNLAWSQSPNTLKMIFVVGDAPPKHYKDGWEPEVWAKRAAQQGIVVNTVRCGEDLATEAAFRQLARLGEGSYSSLDGSGGMVAVRTPYDERLASLNSEIASHTLYSGDDATRGEAERKKDVAAKLPPSEAADRLSYVRAAGVGGVAAYAPPAPKGGVDLVAKPDSLASTPEASLPEPLKALPQPARKAYVEKVSKERSVLEKQAQTLTEERETWMKANVKQKEDSLDAKVMDQVKTLGAKHGIAY